MVTWFGFTTGTGSFDKVRITGIVIEGLPSAVDLTTTLFA
jgi:hypothetical protein